MSPNRGFVISMAMLLALGASGCGPSGIIAKGKLTKNGEPIATRKGESLGLSFLPYNEEGSPPHDVYDAVLRPDGTFEVWGPKRRGIPAGKYRISIEFMKGEKDKWRDKYGWMNSPIVREVKG